MNTSRSEMARGLAFGLGAAFIGASYLVVGKLGMQVDGYGSDELLLFRYAGASVIGLPWLIWRGLGSIHRVALFKLFGLAALAGLAFPSLLFAGLARATASHAAVIPSGAIALGTLLFGALWFGEPLRRSRIAGATLIVAGLAVLRPHVTDDPTAASTALGDALLASAGLVWAAFALLLRRWQLLPLRVAAVSAVLGLLVFGPVYAQGHDGSTLTASGVAPAVLQLLAQGVLAGLGSITLFGFAGQLLGARAGLFAALTPALALLMAVPLLGVWPHPAEWLGLALLSLGLLVAMGLVRSVQTFLMSAFHPQPGVTHV